MLPTEHLAELTEKLDTIAADYAQRGWWAEAIHLLKMGIRVAQSMTAVPHTAARLQARLAGLLWKQGEMATAYALLRRAKQAAEQAGDLPTLALALFNLGELHTVKCFTMLVGNHYQAVDFHQQALALRQQLGDKAGVVESLGRLGLIYERLGKEDEAAEYYAQALALAEAIGDERGQLRPLARLAAHHQKQGAWLNALADAKIVLALRVAHEDWEGVVFSLQTLANASFGLTNCLEKALSYAKQSLAIAEQLDFKLGMTQALYQIGCLYARAGIHGHAADYLLEAAELAEANYFQALSRPALAQIAALRQPHAMLN